MVVFGRPEQDHGSFPQKETRVKVYRARKPPAFRRTIFAGREQGWFNNNII